MSREEDTQELLDIIKLVHENVKLDNYLENVLIIAVKQLKKNDLPSYVASELVYRLSYYFMRHVGMKHNEYLDRLYKLANKISNKYKGFFTYV